MQIVKRTGQTEGYLAEKIANAMRAAFKSAGTDDSQVDVMTQEIEQELVSLSEAGNQIHIETIQDLVEKTLIKHDYHVEVKKFIIYREDRSKKRQSLKNITKDFSNPTVKMVLRQVQKDFTDDEYSLDVLYHKYLSFRKDEMKESESLAMLIKAAVELTTQEAPKWEFIASRLLMIQFKVKLGIELQAHAIASFYEKIHYLTDEGLYGTYILENYTKKEIDELEKVLLRYEGNGHNRNNLLTYSSLDLLLRRYVIRTHSHVAIETPQEMFMGIAMHLAVNEKQNRLEWVERFYDMLSLLQVTVATPTLSNARKPYHQLSSCFIDTVPDSLDGIFRSIDNFAKVSKLGGGMGMYFGKVRASGSAIRGFQGAAGGIIRWIKIANDTAVAVDQLGVRQGSVAVYLDVWHKDLPEFLQLRTNNGDDRMKAHDVFPAVCYPDLFWKTVRDNIDSPWYLMCPHEIEKVKGYALEDFYGEEWEKRYQECVEDNRISKREINVKELVRLILKSAVETGTPFAFNRDIVNRANPNAHKGIIYCSNLCTEIAQNMSGIELVSREITTQEGEKVIVEVTKPGDFVVCNLASLVLGNIDVDDDEALKKVCESATRALDNVIDLNYYPLMYAEVTNKRYRSIGLGTSGYHHLLAQKGIQWESEEHLVFADTLFEKINRFVVGASATIAQDKGSYEYFEGSDWQTGAYFEKRNYTGKEWDEVKKLCSKGMRNAYLMAVAPTSSTSIIAGTSAGVDPIMKRFFLEEKKGSIMPRVAPNLNPQTFWLYKNAHTINQEWSIRASGVRQRHIDQAQSVNLYITNDFTIRQVLNLYIKAWEEGVKCIYYVRSQALEVEECEVCAS